MRRTRMVTTMALVLGCAAACMSQSRPGSPSGPEATTPGPVRTAPPPAGPAEAYGPGLGAMGGGYPGGLGAPGAVPGGALPVPTVRLRYQVLFAWDPNRLPSMNDEALRSLCDRLGNRVQSRRRIPQGDVVSPARASYREANWTDGNLPGPGWKACLITVEPTMPAGSTAGPEGLQELRRRRVEYPEGLRAGAASWLNEMDALEGLSRPIYEKIEAERGRASKELAEIKESGQIRDLARQLPELEMALEGKAVRQKALEDKIAEIRTQVKAKTERDAVLTQLHEIARTREEAMKALDEADANARLTLTDQHPRLREIQERRKEAQLKLLEAKVQIAQREEALTNAAGGELLSRLAGEQAMLAIDLAELDGRQALLRRKINNLEANRESLEAAVRNANARIEAAKPYLVRPVAEPEAMPAEK
jgi:hypothetical protein